MQIQYIPLIAKDYEWPLEITCFMHLSAATTTSCNQGAVKNKYFGNPQSLFEKMKMSSMEGDLGSLSVMPTNEYSRRKAGSQRSGESLFREVKKRFEYKNLFEAQVEGILLNAETVHSLFLS